MWLSGPRLVQRSLGISRETRALQGRLHRVTQSHPECPFPGVWGGALKLPEATGVPRGLPNLPSLPRSAAAADCFFFLLFFTYRVKPGEVWGWRMQRSACSAPRRGAQEPPGSPLQCRRRHWPPHLWCSSSRSYRGGNHLCSEGGGHWPPHPLPPRVHDSTIYLFKVGLQQIWSGLVGEEPYLLPHQSEILGG